MSLQPCISSILQPCLKDAFGYEEAGTPSGDNIVTEGGVQITTEGGSNIVTE